MEIFFKSEDLIILLSLASMGFFGGFSHCLTMCGPFVITQVSQQLSTSSIQDYYGLKKITKIALLPYHLGRITTYAVIGLVGAWLRTNLDHQIGFELFSAILILLACLYFINLFLTTNIQNFKKIGNFLAKQNRKKSTLLKPTFRFHNLLNFSTPKLIKKYYQSISKKINHKINFLLNNSKGINGYILGIILGFLPCGMLYGAFALASNLSHYLLAFLGMIIFGFATFWALFAVGLFAKLSFKLPEFKIIANIVIIINILMLFKMFLKKIF